MSKILSFPRLAERALQALLLLLGILIISSLLLVPGESIIENGFEILAVGFFVWIGNLRLDLGNVRKSDKKYKSAFVRNAVFNQAILLFYIIAGIVTIVFGEDGIYLLVPAVILSFVKAISEAWVLLVEINR